MMRFWLAAGVFIALGVCSGCWQTPPRLTTYVALDREFSEPILRDFEREAKIRVAAKYDLESTKTVGLVNAILQERDRPRCDLFWNNEILHTIRLDHLGLLRKFTPEHAADVPPMFVSPQGTYYGFAARARVLLVNTTLVKENELPQSILDLIDPKWRGKVGIAKPLFGTTATHAAVLWHTWGEEQAEAFFTQLREQAQILGGNKRVAEAVGQGELAFGLTDTDDALIELEAGRPVRIVFPDQQPDGLGTLLIPNTVCLLKNSPNPAAAEALVNRILSSPTEARLAASSSGQIPLLAVTGKKPVSRVLPTEEVRWQKADYVQAAAVWETAAKFLREKFTQ